MQCNTNHTVKEMVVEIQMLCIQQTSANPGPNQRFVEVIFKPLKPKLSRTTIKNSQNHVHSNHHFYQILIIMNQHKLGIILHSVYIFVKFYRYTLSKTGLVSYSNKRTCYKVFLWPNLGKGQTKTNGRQGAITTTDIYQKRLLMNQNKSTYRDL